MMKTNVQSLVCFDDRVEAETARPHAVLGALANDAQIVHKQPPDERGENGVQHKPHEGIVEVLEGEHFHQRADKIEKVMHELQRPPDEGEGVDKRARPEEQDGQKRDAHIKPGRGRSLREDAAGVIGQDRKSQALDNAGERELDVDDDLIQLAAAGGRRFHDRSRSRSVGRVSTLQPRSAASPRLAQASSLHAD